MPSPDPNLGNNTIIGQLLLPQQTTSAVADPFANYSFTDDRVWSGWKYVHDMDPTIDDTSGWTIEDNDPTDPDKPDSEVFAEIRSLDTLFGQTDIQKAPWWTDDWADGGVNYGTPYYIGTPYVANTTPQPGTTPTYYVIFHAEQPGVEGSQFVEGQPYNIKSLDDLRKGYPSLLTSLNDLYVPQQIDLNPNPTSLLTIAAPQTVTHGVPFYITVTAKDSDSNIASSDDDQLGFSDGAFSADFPSDANLNYGQNTFAVTLYVTGSQTITVTDNARAGVVQAEFTVTAN